MAALTSHSTLIAYDCSGSTGRDNYYYSFVKETVAAHPHATVVAWDHGVSVVSAEMFKRGTFPIGRGMTEPSCLVPYFARTQFRGNLVLITDGQIDNTEVDLADRAVSQHKIRLASVTAHFVEIDGGVFNIGVTAAFTRKCPHVIYHHVRGHIMKSMEVVQLDLNSIDDIDRISSLSEFDRYYDSLEKAVIARTIRSEKNSKLHDRLTRMQKRIVASLSEDSTAEAKSELDRLEKAIRKGDEINALMAAESITAQYYKSLTSPNSFHARMSRLLHYTGGGLRNVQNPSEIASNQARTAGAIPTVPLPDEPATDFECPISLDTDAPALLIKAGDPLLQAFNDEPKVLDRLINFPLTAVRRMLPAIIARLDHPIGSSIYATGGIRESPMTRAPVLDVLLFGTTNESVTYTNRTIARMLSYEGLRLGNPDLWFAVILEAIEQTEYLQGMVEAARDHMRWRLLHRKSYASLTGLSQYVATKLSLGVCCWFVLASSLARPAHLTSDTDVTRAHVETTDSLLKLCSLVSYRVPALAIQHARRLSGLFTLLSACKKEGRNGLDGNTVFKLAVAALRQNAYQVYPGVFLPLDGGARPVTANEAREFLYSQTGPAARELTMDELYALGQTVSPSLSAGSIELPVKYHVPEFPRPKESWPGYAEKPPVPVRICPNTCRPYMSVTTGGTVQTWEAVATRLYGPKLLSTKKTYAILVAKLGRYPTKEELAMELYRFYVAEKRIPTLPSRLEDFLDETIASFCDVSSSLDPSRFLMRFTLSSKKNNRQMIEDGKIKVA